MKLTKVIVWSSLTIHASEGKHLTKGIKLGKERQRMVTAGSQNHWQVTANDANVSMSGQVPAGECP